MMPALKEVSDESPTMKSAYEEADRKRGETKSKGDSMLQAFDAFYATFKPKSLDAFLEARTKSAEAIANAFSASEGLEEVSAAVKALNLSMSESKWFKHFDFIIEHLEELKKFEVPLAKDMEEVCRQKIEESIDLNNAKIVQEKLVAHLKFLRVVCTKMGLGVVITTHVQSNKTAGIVQFLSNRSVRTLVVVAGATSNASIFPGATTWHVPYNNFDSTGLMAVYNSPKEASAAVGEAFFYLHDTVQVNDTFVRQLTHAKPRLCSLVRRPSMNMGVYTVSAIREHGQRLYAARSPPFPTKTQLQTIKSQAVRQEDFIYRAAKCSCFLSPRPVIRSPAMGSMRREERFEQWGLVKMKANWYVKKVWVI